MCLFIPNILILIDVMDNRKAGYVKTESRYFQKDKKIKLKREQLYSLIYYNN